MKRIRHVVAFACLFILGACASDGEQTTLAGDSSRADLFEYAVNAEGIPKTFPKEFIFPEHVREAQMFGIDVSHHQGALNWDQILATKVAFVYAKATEGSTYQDPRFKLNWDALALAKAKGAQVNRGAYHFLSASKSVDRQVKNFLNTVGDLAADDLAPCLDIEWDQVRDKNGYVLDENGDRIDRWADYTPAEIIEKAKAWLEMVEKKTGKRPIIYTNFNWWKAHIKDDKSLAGYKIWAADYGSFALERESPRVPPGHEWVMWQMTESGAIPGAGIGKIDASVFDGTRDEFLSWCCGLPITPTGGTAPQ